MLADFRPENHLERVFVQASTWNARRVWREGAKSLLKEEWDKASIQFLNLANHYAINDENTRLLEVIDSICKHAEYISPRAKQTLCKLCCSMVTSLFNTGDIIGDTRINVLISGMLKLTISMKHRDMLLVDMLGYLRTLFRKDILFEQLQTLVQELEETLPKRKGVEDWPWTEESNLIKNPQITQTAHKPVTTSLFKAGLTKKERLEILHNNLADASVNYGDKSPEVASALVKLVQETSSSKDNFSTSTFLKELLALLQDENVTLNNFQLREVASLSERLPKITELLNMAESLERLIFERKEKSIGYDASISVLLIRLVKLWQETNKFEDGQTFCSSLSENVSRLRGQNDIVLKQVLSAQRLVEQFSERLASVQNILSFIAGSRFEEPTEFVSMITLVSLDKMNSDKLVEASPELQELLAYYSECFGETALKVGEMLWLLVETELRYSPGFAQRLALLSLNKAEDALLCRRLLGHLDHVSLLHPDLMVIEPIIKHCEMRLAELLKSTESPQQLPFKEENGDNRFPPSNEESDLQKVDGFISRREWTIAEKYINDRLEVSGLSSADKNRLLIRLARTYVAKADLFKASTIIHNVFSAHEIS